MGGGEAKGARRLSQCAWTSGGCGSAAERPRVEQRGRGGYTRQFRVRVRRLRGGMVVDGREIAAVEGKPEAGGGGAFSVNAFSVKSAQQGADDVGAQ